MYAMYGNIYHQYTPFMLAYLPAPWIRHGYYDTWGVGSTWYLKIWERLDALPILLPFHGRTFLVIYHGRTEEAPWFFYGIMNDRLKTVSDSENIEFLRIFPVHFNGKPHLGTEVAFLRWDLRYLFDSMTGRAPSGVGAIDRIFHGSSAWGFRVLLQDSPIFGKAKPGFL